MMKKKLFTSAMAGLLVVGMGLSSAYAQSHPQDQQKQQQSQQGKQGNQGQQHSQGNKDKGQQQGPSSNQSQKQQGNNANKQNGANRGSEMGQQQSNRDTAQQGGQQGGAKGKGSYAVDSRNKQTMKQHYQRILGNVDKQHRPSLQQGQPMPSKYRPYITAAPNSLKKRIPAVPNGYDIGYYQGYVVVYDPETFVILTLVDLLLNS